MTKPKLTRRGFLKLAGASAASTAVLTGCGPASRYVVREPYADMPEYTYNGESTYYATTCQECAAGCGIIVRTFQGRAIKVEGNPIHPVNAGKTCARGQASIQGLYNPDRIQFPTHQNRQRSLNADRFSWDQAIEVVTDAIKDSDPNQIGFLLGNTHDHLADLVQELFSKIGSSKIYRINAQLVWNAPLSVSKSSEEFFDQATQLNYGIKNSDFILSFGANFLETWGSPVSHTRQYSEFRKGQHGKRGELIHFEPRLSQTGSVADQWVPITPGTENIIALAIGRLISEIQGQLPEAYSDVDPSEYAELAGVSIDILTELAEKFVFADAPLAIPGSFPAAQENGVSHLHAILALNSLAVLSGKPNLVFSTPAESLPSVSNQTTSTEEIRGLISNLNTGKITTLFIHGTNPVFEIPKNFGFHDALPKADKIISFSSYPDETALMADYIFPDHTTLESWGYQQVSTGVSGATISGLQPVVSPYFETRSTVDVLLSTIQQLGGELANEFPLDEVAYLESKLSNLVGQENSLIRAGESKTFMSQFQQYGGWWVETDQRASLNPSLIKPEAEIKEAKLADGEFFLHIFMSPTLAEKGANKPWLQETPDPTTTVMWNTWIEINPETAKELGIHDDDILRLKTPYGQIEAPAYLYPAIRPDTIAIPFGQGHTAYGRYAQDRGANPFDLLPPQTNAAGDLILNPLIGKLEKTGRHKQLARLESRIGVYGFDEH